MFSLLAVQYAIDRNDSKLADSILKSISPEIKESPLYRNQYGRYLLLTQQYEEALPYLKGAYESEPSFFHLSQVNNAYLGLLKPEEAISYIDKHLEVTPDDALAKMLKADVLMWTKPDEAIEEYKRLLITYPKNAVAMNNVAWLYMQKDDYNMARTYALQAVDLFPKNANFLDTLALTYLKEKDFTTASSLLKVAVENNPSDINVYFNYAESLYGQGKSGDAVATLKRITTTDPKLIEIIRLKIEKYR